MLLLFFGEQGDAYIHSNVVTLTGYKRSITLIGYKRSVTLTGRKRAITLFGYM